MDRPFLGVQGSPGRKLRAGALAVLLACALFAGLLSASAASTSAVTPAAHPPRPNPIAVQHYLAAQRAGYGPPAHAAVLARRAVTRAQAIRSRRAAPAAGVPNPTAAWSPLGPAPISYSFYGGPNSGRVTATAVVSTGTNAGEIFVGTGGGGVWSSKDDGASWVTHTDQVATGLAIGALAIDPTDPSIVYAGTGEANNSGDSFYGDGVLKSTDGGDTWSVENPGGVFSGAKFASIVVDPNHHQNLYAGTSQGFFKSTDGGQSWAHPTGAGRFQRPTYGVVVDPTTSATTVYIATSGVGIQKSTNGGVSFSTLGGLFGPSGGRPPDANHFGVTALGIGTHTAAHPSANRRLYASVQVTDTTSDPDGGHLSIYSSTDGGTTWTLSGAPAYGNPGYAFDGVPNSLQEQAAYDNALAVDPADPAHVIAGGIATVDTTDRGSTWTNVNGGGFYEVAHNVVHPDVHALAFTASGNVVMGNDGGVYEYDPRTRGARGVSDLNTNLNTTQFYSDLGVYKNGTSILGGLQDNGTVLYSGTPGWGQPVAGDGGSSAINPLDVNQQFGEANTTLVRTANAWQPSYSNITPPGGLTGANFVAPLAIVPNPLSHDSPTVYYGGGALYVTHDPASGVPDWTELASVGEPVSAIAVAPSDPAMLYVGFNNGRLLVSTDATADTPSFTDISPGVGQWVRHIDVNQVDPGSIAVSFSASETHTTPTPPMVDTATVALTGTPSATYTDVTGDLPTGVASNSVLSRDGTLVVATDVGVFSASTPDGASTRWSAVGTGLPNVQVIGLSVDANGDFYAATHGRGVWKLPAAPTGAVPTNTAAPAISGHAVQGQVVSASNGSWTGSPSSYRYQWQDCDAFGGGCSNISGATGPTYRLTAADIGHTIRVLVTATNGLGSASAASAVTAAVTAARPLALSGVAFVPRSFAARKGTALRATLSEPATVTVSISHRVGGRRARGKCSRRAKRGRRCAVRAHVATLTFDGVSGPNRFRVSVKRLRPGVYRARVTVRNTAGVTSAPTAIAFRVNKPRA